MDVIAGKSNPLFTIGYSDLNIERFLSLLKKHSIETVVDVRSSPFSKFYPEFNYDNLRQILRTHGVRCAFLGKELGAQRSEEECYVDGKVSYDLVFETEAFQSGIQRLIDGVGRMRVTLLCAEKDPLNCHRAILICRYLRDTIIQINHILNNGSLEGHNELERRLLSLLKLNNAELFKSEKDILVDAYRRQAERISFSKDEIIAKKRKYDNG